MDKKADFDYEAYKLMATIDDVKRIEQKYKPKKWENIPLVGAITYIVRMGIEMAEIDRGTLRKQILKYHMIFLFVFLIYIYTIITIITPWFQHVIFKKAINKTKILIKEDKI